MISARDGHAALPGVEDVELRPFVSQKCGATAFSTGTAIFKPGAVLPYHQHSISEAIVVLEGQARVLVQGRSYLLQPLDCVHVPAGTAHSVENPDATRSLLAFSAFASSTPDRIQVDNTFPLDDRGPAQPHDGDPETILRFAQTEKYELSRNAFFSDLFARRYGSHGICGGYGRFLPGASLPCHTHDFDESITIVGGKATCLVAGRKYELSGYETAFVPQGKPHRFINTSTEEMAMIWVYAGDEPDRQIVDARYCTGELAWPGPSPSPTTAKK